VTFIIFKPVLINNLSYVTLRPISMFPGKVALVKFDYIQYEYVKPVYDTLDVFVCRNKYHCRGNQNRKPEQ
jgi:hypothetical protein